MSQLLTNLKKTINPTDKRAAAARCVLSKGRPQFKKNVFFRALPESPKPPPGWIMVKIGNSFVFFDDKVKGFYILCCGGERSRRPAVLSRAVVALVGQTLEDIEARGGLLRQFL